MSGQELPLSKKAKTVIVHAQREAGRLLHSAVEPEHLFLGILRQGDCFAANLVRQVAPDVEALQQEVEQLLGPGTLENVALDIPLSSRTQEFLAQTELARRQLHHDEIRSDHLLLVMTHDTAGRLAPVLAQHGLSTKRVLEAILAEFGVVQQASPIEIVLLQGLSKKGGLTPRVVEALLNRKEGQGVKEVLLAEGLITEDEITGTLAKEFGCQAMDVAGFSPDLQLVKQFPADLARRLQVFPVRFDIDEDTLYVALVNPFEGHKLEEIQGLWGVNVVPLLASERTIQELLDNHFPHD